ncbi:MAG: hypothetical protein GY835_04730 [bacterium]|nr:hypothetical protein [bacterium]
MCEKMTSRLKIALNGEDLDLDEIWAAYEDAWIRQKSPPMDVSIFEHLLDDRSRSHRAKILVRESDSAFKTLKEAASQVDLLSLANPHRRTVFISTLMGREDYILERWQTRRRDATAQDRKNLAEIITRVILEQVGRERTRQIITHLWPKINLLEEESETIIKALGEENMLSRSFLRNLGTGAEDAARRLVHQEIITIDWTGDGLTLKIPGHNSSDARKRVGMLLKEVQIPTDLSDARLESDEYRRVLSIGQIPAIESGSVKFCCPLIRLLHMQEILQAPTLRKALETAGIFYPGAVISYLLNIDGISYAPELRIATDAEQRWRARHVESLGEAFSVLMLQDALDLNLATLDRISTSNEPTPDFRVETLERERITFEAKGSTSWHTHREQRRKALKQLSKFKGESASGNGRAFACSLFAARQDDNKPSKFYVADPSFLFQRLFHEDWRNAAQRRHCAAILQVAGQHKLAEQLLQRERPPVEIPRPERFTIEYTEPEGRTEKEEDRELFVGSYDMLGNIAQWFGHPNPRSFAGIYLFCGLGQELYRTLRDGAFPMVGKQRVNTYKSTVGALPGLNGFPRGAYSQLSDGSFLAVAVE